MPIRNAAGFRAQAEKCRSLARGSSDALMIANLLDLAVEYEGEAERLTILLEPPLIIPR